MCKSSQKQIRCPKCSNTVDMTVWESINLSERPDLKKELLAGKINMFRCPQCGNTILIADKLTLRDDEKRFILTFMPCMNREDKLKKFDALKKQSEETGDIRDIFGYKLRFVADFNSLLEKVLIFDNDLLDKTIEVLKLVVMANNPDKVNTSVCRFGRINRDEEKVEFLIQDIKNKKLYTSVVPKQTYEAIDKQVQISGIKPYSFDWELIDADYATRIFSGLNNRR